MLQERVEHASVFVFCIRKSVGFGYELRSLVKSVETSVHVRISKINIEILSSNKSSFLSFSKHEKTGKLEAIYNFETE